MNDDLRPLLILAYTAGYIRRRFLCNHPQHYWCSCCEGVPGRLD